MKKQIRCTFCKSNAYCILTEHTGYCYRCYSVFEYNK